MGLIGALKALALKETYISGMRTPGHFHFTDFSYGARSLYYLRARLGRPKYPGFSWDYLGYFLANLDEVYEPDTPM
jgi:hypothetical protein